MRISDWSSDVCSSDLDRRPRHSPARAEHSFSFRNRGCSQSIAARPPQAGEDRHSARSTCSHCQGQHYRQQWRGDSCRHNSPASAENNCCRAECCNWDLKAMTDCKTSRSRSEEHTSELQSLMRTSYAVFCLKKKKI